jgi:guanylate kinase
MGQSVKFELDRLLFERKMKVPELMEKSGVNKNTLYAIKNNTITRVDLKVIQAICDALQCPLSDLMKYVPSTTDKSKGKIFIISGPSGAGKNTLINELKRTTDLDLVYIPSFTTRAMREGESQGNPYHFLSPRTFMEMVQRGEFLEYEQIHGNFYGTHLLTYRDAVEKGKYVIKDIDVNGALNFKKAFNDKVVLIYVRPTSLDVLKDRLVGRGDDQTDIEVRLKRIDWEESRGSLFDFVIYNDDLEHAVNKLKDIILTFMNAEEAAIRE